MIITDVNGLGRAAAAAGPAIQWSCLARRGMLHSECEAVDYLELPPGAAVTMDGRSGTEEAWYVLSGTAEILTETAEVLTGAAEILAGTVEVLDGAAGRPRRIGAGCLVLRPAKAAPEIRNGSADEPLRLLLISVLPRPVTEKLPGRSPVAEETT